MLTSRTMDDSRWLAREQRHRIWSSAISASRGYGRLRLSPRLARGTGDCTAHALSRYLDTASPNIKLRRNKQVWIASCPNRLQARASKRCSTSMAAAELDPPSISDLGAAVLPTRLGGSCRFQRLDSENAAVRSATIDRFFNRRPQPIIPN
jgi:hypothetical protein